MCWWTVKTSYFKPIVAEEEISILKVGRWDDENKVAKPYFKYNRELEYVEGKEYTETIVKSTSSLMQIEHGLHSFKKDYVWLEIEPWKEINWVDVIAKREPDNGFKVDFDIITFRGEAKDMSIIEGHLPVGTTFYINEDYEIVSNRLVIDRITPLGEHNLKETCVGQPKS